MRKERKINMKIKLVVSKEELNSAHIANEKYTTGFLGENIAREALKLYESKEVLQHKGKYVTTTYTPLEDGGAEVEYEIENATFIKFLQFQQKYVADIKEFTMLLVPFVKGLINMAGTDKIRNVVIKLWKAFKEEVL